MDFSGFFSWKNSQSKRKRSRGSFLWKIFVSSKYMPKYYIICVCLEHAKRGIAWGFIQSNHGKSTNIKKLKMGDGILIYSSKYVFTPLKTEENKLQAFTALGYVRDEELYQWDMGWEFTPFRRNIDFQDDITTLPIIPLLSDLEFVKDVKKWGFPLMYAFLEISEHDFEFIRSRMMNLQTSSDF